MKDIRYTAEFKAEAIKQVTRSRPHCNRLCATPNHATVYATRLASTPDAQELKLLELIDAEYTRHPFYGSRKIKHYLNGLGSKVYQSASGGGAKIVDKYSGLERLRLEIALKKDTKAGQRC